MTFYATICFFLISIAVGFAIGINLRGNPPKRTRKRKNQPAPTGQLEP